MSPGIGVIGGTELRALATMGGSLYAGNSYWTDSRRADPALPGAQVLVLDAPAGSWKVDTELSDHENVRDHDIGAERTGLRAHPVLLSSCVTRGADATGSSMSSSRFDA
jgi:hypothetical protein